MSPEWRRGGFEICMNVLEAVSANDSVSGIMRASNTTFKVCRKYLEILMEHKMVMKDTPKLRFFVTVNGWAALRRWREIQELLEESI